MDYYTLKPVYSENSVIYVPMHNEALLHKMRRVLSPEEIYALIQAMPYQEVSWIEDENKRKETCRDILSRGDRMELIRAIKALYLHPVSYTHLDVYKRQAPSRGNSPSKAIWVSRESFFRKELSSPRGF